MNFDAYKAALSGDEGQDKADTGVEKDHSIRTYNSKFEEIKEIRQDGEITTVIRSLNQYKQNAANQRRFGKFSLLLHRIVSNNNTQNPILQLEIQSDILRNEFRRLASHFTSINLYKNPIVIHEPFREIYHCKDQIQDALHKASTETRQELQLLVDFQIWYMSHTIETIRSFIESRTIDFEWLWSLFKPGSHIIIQEARSSYAPIEWCTVLKSYDTSVQDGTGRWSICVTHTGFNGETFGNVESTFTFPSFSGTLPISQLPAYPLQFHKSQESLKDMIVDRGKMYQQYCIASRKGLQSPIGSSMAYEGPFWKVSTEDDDPRGFQMIKSPSYNTQGRVVVDVDGFFNCYPRFRDTLITESNENDISNDANDSIDSATLIQESLSTEQLLTCSPFVPVFSFTTHEWGLVPINGLDNIIWDTVVYDKLEVKEDVKNILRVLVNGHSNHSPNFDDFVQGKGRGLVLLLHGPPGCGKTMTAESIAESLKKLLYRVSSDKLGTSIHEMHRRLESTFDLAARWGAILLLDEVDAFLAQRHGEIAEKNSLLPGQTSIDFCAQSLIT
ncbi:uncharacterized protein GGS22DRAFT_196487 [Annulohypoxylon maeteangense]|uniref:uncharacterized protein n=1 Tax=Annulohypoxylon maeteangense TaxID=1927788 RepID=UPI0020074D83|nr:uncharacterized protein GGS22DRAFT_196487 [Annulohypoxylon maeteangense]KAI0881571.1 hypothetical protein GGS22DRAFT_196487 [Annulohypoxylon maeteangense]